MKCPKCQTEMEKGILGSHGQLWSNKGGSRMLPRWLTFGGKPVDAWSCPECGKVELYIETKGDR